MDEQRLAQVGLRYAVDGAVATITLDRPQVRNAQTPAMWRTLAELGRSIGDEVRVVVVTGEGASFSAGLDTSVLDPSQRSQDSLLDLLELDDAGMADAIGEFQEGFTFLRDPRFVSVAAVRGHAVGAGFQLALSCDLRIAADDAKFCMKEAALGLVPDLTGTKPLVDVVGYSRALEICATARTVRAEEALALGIVQQVVPSEELEDAVGAMVSALTAPMPGAVRETKGLLLDAERRSLDEQRRVEREAQVRRFREVAGLAGL